MNTLKLTFPFFLEPNKGNPLFLFQICLYLWELMVCYAFGKERKNSSWFFSWGGAEQ